MRNNFRSWTKGPEAPDFFEKSFQRQDLAAWDARRHGLSIQARYFFLHVVKGPARRQKVYSRPPSVSSELFPPGVLKELTDAGFVEVQPAGSRGFTDRVVARPGLFDFATRLRTLLRMHLLAPD